MCNCFTFENQGINPECKEHSNKVYAEWIRSTGYGSDYYFTKVEVLGKTGKNSVKVKELKTGKLHTIRESSLR